MGINDQKLKEMIKQGDSNGQSFVEKWHSQGDDLGNRNIHEKSLCISFRWLVCTNFEDQIFVRG